MAAKVKSLLIRNLIRKLSPQHLKSFYTLSNSVEFDDYKEVVSNIKHNTATTFMTLNHQNNRDYITNEAIWSMGILQGLQMMVKVIEASGLEHDRREGLKKRKKPKKKKK